jgi:serine/threonine protein kinase
MDNPEINPETKRFGRYEVVAELGRGAMGVVYRARDPQIDRMVAVKTVSLWGQQSEEENEFRLRFMHEAQAAGRLHHPGIVAIFDVGENPENLNPYIVLEYVAGEALNRILAREKKLPLETALQLAEEIAEALDYAHAQGVIHRDIKPGNILVTETGHAKIADFGIAKLNLAHFTLPGRVLGTPAYMAPEQLNGEGVDGRSDLFSLGVILYAMVTGHSPFQGDSATTVSFKVANREPVAASALDLSLPRELDEVISRAMAKDREQRYQRGAEFAEDVRQLQELLKPGPTTTSLRLVPGTGTRSTITRSGITRSTGTRGTRTGQAASAVHPADGIAQTAKSVRAAIRKVSLRDLILGAVTLVMLMIAGVESKVFAPSPKNAVTAPDAAPVSPASPAAGSSAGSGAAGDLSSAGAGAGPGTAVQPAPAAAPATHSAPRKSHAPTTHTAKQIVVPFSTLDLAVQHQFKDATLFVWVDDKLVLTRPLHGATQKRLVVFNGLRGVESETLKIPAGKHVLRLRALSADETIDLSKTVSAEFIGGASKSLQVTLDKHNTVMRISWQ